MTDRELMQQMYKLLLSEPLLAVCFDRLESMLRERLAQPEQEPVAWIGHLEGGIEYSPYHKAALKLPEGLRFDLYTAPPQRKPLTDEEIKLQALNAELVEALTEICECPQWVDDATVPKAGIDSAPQQVVVNMSVALTRIRKARAVIAKATGEKE